MLGNQNLNRKKGLAPVVGRHFHLQFVRRNLIGETSGVEYCEKVTLLLNLCNERERTLEMCKND